MQSLVGKFVHFSQDEYYSTGEILDVTAELILLRNDPFNGSPVPSQRILPIPVVWEELNIFNSREELEQWMRWVETPVENNKPKVVTINGTKAKE